MTSELTFSGIIAHRDRPSGRRHSDRTDPPHCTNPECPNFHSPPKYRWFVRYGHYRTKLQGMVPRFRCGCCRHVFSLMAYDIDYYNKHWVDYTKVIQLLVCGAGQLDIARYLRERCETIQIRMDRLARSALKAHHEILRHMTPDHSFAADGFESFCRSQYYPNNINLVAGSSCEFLYGLSLSVLRRKGRMTEGQKRRRAHLETRGIPHPRATQMSMRSLIQGLIEVLPNRSGIIRRILYTDDHRAYPKAFRQIRDFSDHFRHVRISSRKVRSRHNPLFPVNYLDRQFRKDLSDHGRETVQYSRCPSAMMSRLTVYQLFHNSIMHHRVKAARKGDRQTRSELMGVPTADLHRILSGLCQRPFYHKLRLTESEKKTWGMEWRNPGVRFGRRVPQFIRV